MKAHKNKISIVVFSNADPGGCVRLLTDCERLQQDDLEFEVILVLQDLTEKEISLLKSYKFSYRIKFILSGGEINRAKGRNMGIAASKFDIILLLDSTLEVSPELLHRHLDLYDDQHTAAVMGEIFLPEFVKKSHWLRFLDSNYRNTRRWSATTKKQISPPLRYVNTSNFSVRKEIYLACEGHRETINNYEAEDIDLAHRISAQKHGIIRFQPEAIAFCQHAPLKSGLKQKYNFGYEGIPKLLKLYPDLYHVLSSRFVKTEGFNQRRPVFRLLMTVLFTAPIFFLARGLRLISPEAIAFRMLRYMLQYQAILGFRAAIKENKRQKNNL